MRVKMTQLLDKFRELPDYRKCKQLKFNVGEIMFISLLATLSGANGYADMEIWIKMLTLDPLGHSAAFSSDTQLEMIRTAS